MFEANRSRAYRPELHYMRGPGPRWHEKNAAPTAAPSEPRLALPHYSWFIPAAMAALMLAVMALTFA
ncbi:MAG TPA: hypothetical protein VLB11_01075 [Methyloceanibacter sp.]|nr:hypothetical protein [Methyloceanibacter sp.]